MYSSVTNRVPITRDEGPGGVRRREPPRVTCTVVRDRHGVEPGRTKELRGTGRASSAFGP
jgi:hypothetical protein